MSLKAVDSYLQVQANLEARLRDPLKHFRFGLKVERMREAFRMFTAPDPIDELHLRACNKGGKTLTSAAFVMACLQRRASLDGVPIPRWRGRVEAIQCVLDNPAMLLSVQPAYERMLGKWPGHIRRNGEYFSSMHVMPEGGDPKDETDWSVVYFRTLDNPNTGIGARADICAFDEPPPMKPLREMRKAAHAGRRGIILIAETPEIRRQWAPLRENYGDTPRRSLRRVDQERAECRWSMDEVADWVLSKAEKDALWRKYQGDPLFGEDGGARWHGDYENTEGACPFHVPTLLKMMDECRDPRLIRCRVQREATDGKTETVDTVEVEIFAEARVGMSYYIAIDPASGVDDNKHNPACLHVCERGSGNLMARWNGYLSPYSVGVLAGGLARRLYNDADIDIEMRDHFGSNVIRGCQQGADYWNLLHEQRELTPGNWAREIGFDQNEESRAIIIGSIQEWIEAYRAGIKYASCPSRKVLGCLLDATLDERGKIICEVGIDHGEDMICFGQSLRRAVTRSGMLAPELYQPPKSPEAEIMAKILRLEEPEDFRPIMQAPTRSAV